MASMASLFIGMTQGSNADFGTRIGSERLLDTSMLVLVTQNDCLSKVTLFFLFGGTTKHELNSLDKVNDRAMRLIGRSHLNNRAVENMYNIEPLKDRRHRHYLALMDRLSRINGYIDTDRPDITLRSRKKKKFRPLEQN